MKTTILHLKTMIKVTNGLLHNIMYYLARQPVGVDVILGAVARVMQGKLSESTVVDIGKCVTCVLLSTIHLSGCGTGNYALALSPYIGQITGIDYNDGMLEKAIEKTAHLPHVKLLQGNALNLPLPDGYCDAVICTQVG